MKYRGYTKAYWDKMQKAKREKKSNDQKIYDQRKKMGFGKKKKK